MVRYAPAQRLVSKECPKLHLLQMRTAHELEQCMCFKLQELPVVTNKQATVVSKFRGLFGATGLRRFVAVRAL